MNREPDWDGGTPKTGNSEIEATPAAIALGQPIPQVDESVRALMIMSGCTAKFVLNYWMMTHTRTGKRANVRVGATFDEWREAMDSLGKETGGARYAP